MPRVTRVAKARKDQGRCSGCGCDIKKWDSYLWWQFAFGTKNKRCAKPACAPKASDLTQSEYYGNMASHEETLSDIRSRLTADQDDDLESLSGEVNDLADEIESYGQEQEDKRSNMPEGLQDSETGELLQARADACQELSSQLQDLASAISDISGEFIDEGLAQTELERMLHESEHVTMGERKDFTDDEWVVHLEELRVEHNEAVREEADFKFDDVSWEVE